MDVRELRERRRKLEADIAAAVEGFNRDTGIWPDGVETKIVEDLSVHGNPTRLYVCFVRVKLSV